jgi:hypothetical protein
MADAREEIEQLLRYLLPVAEEQLNRTGEFRPYAATLDSDGSVNSVAAVEGEEPDVGALLVALHTELREQAAGGTIRASGIAADVTLTDPDSGEETDAVQLELDHVETDAIDVYVPYTSGDEGITFGDLVAAAGQAPVFGTG